MIQVYIIAGYGINTSRIVEAIKKLALIEAVIIQPETNTQTEIEKFNLEELIKDFQIPTIKAQDLEEYFPNPKNYEHLSEKYYQSKKKSSRHETMSRQNKFNAYRASGSWGRERK